MVSFGGLLSKITQKIPQLGNVAANPNVVQAATKADEVTARLASPGGMSQLGQQLKGFGGAALQNPTVRTGATMAAWGVVPTIAAMGVTGLMSGGSNGEQPPPDAAAQADQMMQGQQLPPGMAPGSASTIPLQNQQAGGGEGVVTVADKELLMRAQVQAMAQERKQREKEYVNAIAQMGRGMY